MSALSPQQGATPSPAVSSATFGPGASGSHTNATSNAQTSLPGGAQTAHASDRGSARAAPPSVSSNGTLSEAPHIIEGPSGRILCVADVRGNIGLLNSLAAEHQASAIIHTGDFGFYNTDSLDRISDKTLRHLVQYSALIPQQLRNKLLGADPVRGAQPPPAAAAAASSTSGMRAQIASSPTPLLSEFPLLLSGALKLDVPVFTVWGACEDVAVLERFRVGDYRVHNLQILDEATTRAIEVGGVRLRLFGLGGAVVYHKLFDNGEGAATIAGGQGTMWTTILQIGELIDTAQKHFDPSETRVLITHASSGREGLLAQVALAVKADLTISAGLHFRYGLSYNEFSVQHDTENYRNKLVHAKAAFGEVWDTVKTQVEEVIDPNQRVLLNHALAATNRVPPLATATGAASEEPAWKNTWNWNLPDAVYGSLVLDIKEGRIGSEMRSQGFNFAYRKSNVPSSIAGTAPSHAHNGPLAHPAGHVAAAGLGRQAMPAAAAAGGIAVKSPPTGPGSAFKQQAPPSGPKGGTTNAFPKGQGPSAAPRSQHQRVATGGSAALSSSDTEQVRSKGQHPSRPQGKATQQRSADGSRDLTSNGKHPSGKDVPKEGPASGSEGPLGKPKKSRGGKQKGPGGSKSAGEGGETSGAEGLTSANEGALSSSKKEGGKPKKRDDKQTQQQQQQQQHKQTSSKGDWDKSAEQADGGAARDGEGKGGDAVASTKPGDESGKEGGSGSNRGGSRGGSRGGRGGARGGRGGRGKSTSGGSTSADGSSAPAAGASEGAGGAGATNGSS
ncbi:unnamed protein product [Parajaminaea phylloscopi]